MKHVSGFLRLIKYVIGWTFVILFGVAGVYSLLDEVQDGFAVVVTCLLLALAGLAMIRSAHRDKRKLETEREEETQYRRRIEEEQRERAAQEKREAIVYKAVECPGCGAVAQVRKGSVVHCEYCGTALEGK